MRGVAANDTTLRPPASTRSAVTGMFDKARKSAGAVTDSSNVALNAGSSQPGNTRRAPLGSRSVASTHRRPAGVS